MKRFIEIITDRKRYSSFYNTNHHCYIVYYISLKGRGERTYNLVKKTKSLKLTDILSQNRFFKYATYAGHIKPKDFLDLRSKIISSDNYFDSAKNLRIR